MYVCSYVSCLIIHFQDQRQCVGAVRVLILHHVFPNVSPSGRRQHYFSTGRHLAAAAGTNSGTRDATRLGANPRLGERVLPAGERVLPYQWFSITNTNFPFFSRNFRVVGTHSQELRKFWK